MNFTETYKGRKSATETVDLIPPSGFTFKFKKPQMLSFVLGGGLPAQLTAMVVKNPDANKEAISETEIVQNMLIIRDRVLEHSIEPKIVLDDAAAENEISVKDLDDEDLAYFMHYFLHGGNVSSSLENFREGHVATSGNRVNRKKHRSKTK